jgi:hypothetical protein
MGNREAAENQVLRAGSRQNLRKALSAWVQSPCWAPEVGGAAKITEFSLSDIIISAKTIA